MSKRPPPRRFNFSDKRRTFLAAVRDKGTMRSGLEASGIPRRDVTAWVQRFPKFRVAYEEALADFRDSIEARLLEVVDSGDLNALQLLLRGEFPDKYSPKTPFPSSPPRRRGPAGSDCSPIEADGARQAGVAIDPETFWAIADRAEARNDAPVAPQNASGASAGSPPRSP